MKNGIAKIQCKCAHEYQDKTLGVYTRIANATGKQDKDYVEVRCTVCKAVQRIHPSKVK